MRTIASALCLAALWAAPGCTAQISEPGGQPGLQCNDLTPGPTPLRRMTHIQFANTVRDLFGGRIDAGSSFPTTQFPSGFSTYAAWNVVSATGAEDIFNAAGDVAVRAAADLNALLPCDPGGGEAACVEQFITRFGERAYRRPLSTAERATLTQLYDPASSAPLAEQVGEILKVMLQSPQFLYIDESGTLPVDGSSTIAQLDDHAMASRLSFFLWNSMPDDELLAAAGRGELRTAEQIRVQASRMLADGKATEAVRAFHDDFLQLYRIEGLNKDTSLFPSFDQAMANSMREGIKRFASKIVFEGGSFEELLMSRAAFVNDDLEQLFGVDGGSTGPDDWREVELDHSRWAGLLTRPAFTATHSYAAESSPVSRGVAVIRSVLCQDIAPPEGLIPQLPENQPGLTIRDRLAVHRQDPVCAYCHDTIDPIGFAFETYDAFGRHRTEYESGLPVDATGTLAEPAGSFNGPIELSQLLASTERARDCYATQWFRYAHGRPNAQQDSCSLTELKRVFAESGGNILELLVAITQTDAFRFRVLPSE